MTQQEIHRILALDRRILDGVKLSALRRLEERFSMPAYNFKCPKHGVFEVSCRLADWSDVKPCPKCRKPSEQVLLPRRCSGNFGQGVVIHVSADGQTRFPGDPNARVPKGFQKRTLTTIREVEKFEREVNTKLRAESEQHQEREARHFDAIQKKNRSDLRMAMQHFSPMGRALAETAMRINNERKRKTNDCGFQVTILHEDASKNPQIDASTGWKRKYV